jgi:uncharacterized protein (UPF0332 family)
VNSNNNLSRAFIKKAENSLETMSLVKDKDWKISIAYYTMYFSLYSLLMKIGIKCEIHCCTIELMNKVLYDYFSKRDYELLKESMKARIDSQYYIDKKVSDDKFKELIDSTHSFLVKCKRLLDKITVKEIKELRLRL